METQRHTPTNRSGTRTCRLLAVSAIAIAALATSAHANDKADFDARLTEGYAWGIDDHRLDQFTKVTGWQVSNNWYFGRQKGEDSGLTLVWQRSAADQVSLSKDGLRFTRRF